MKTLVRFFFLLICLGSFSAYSQLNRNLEIPVKANNQFLANPWAGGLNFCQFSEIDLDGDGKMDLFVFDKTGEKISTFLNKGTNGTTDYQFAPEYAGKFPKLKNWALLRDYNCDGKMDIFTHSDSGGIALFRNDFSNGNLSFSRVTHLIRSQYSPSLYTNLYVSSEDLPAILDIDGDGDLDVVTFNSWGASVELHINKSVENHGNCGQLNYKLENSCWGNFIEDINSNIILNQGCKGNGSQVNGNTGNSGGNRHAGSTLLVLDLNKDGALDLLLGDIGNRNMVKLINGGTSVNANMSSFDASFPSISQPVDLSLFPGAYYLDLNNDGIKDLLVTPNAQNASENFNSIWYYKNTNKNDSALFNLVQKNFLQDGMIEVGEGAFPVLFDYNNDGLPDLFIGNHGYFSQQGYQSSIALFKNTGSKTSPAFELVTRDYANISSLDLRSVYPTFGDLDGDGDADLIIGDNGGNLSYFENTAGAGNIPHFVLQSTNYFSLRGGNNATPQLFDVNKDGKLDLIVGTQNGILAYFPNKGTVNAPVFNQSDMVRPFGGVDVRANSTTGHSVPNFYVDKADNKIRLLVGSESGNIHYYEDIDGNLDGNFKLLNAHVGLLSEGKRTAPFLTFDLTDNSAPVLLVGNYAGGVSYFDQATDLSVQNNKTGIGSLKIFPVPASGNVTVEPGDEFNAPFTVSIITMLGNSILEKQFSPGEKIEIETISYPNGIYILQLNSPGKTATGKIVIRK